MRDERIVVCCSAGRGKGRGSYGMATPQYTKGYTPPHTQVISSHAYFLLLPLSFSQPLLHPPGRPSLLSLLSLPSLLSLRHLPPPAPTSLSPQSLLLVHGFDDGGGPLRCGPTTDGKHVDDHDRHVLEAVVEGHGESIHRTFCAQHTVQTDLLGGEVNGCGRVRGGDESLQQLSCFNKLSSRFFLS